MRNRTRSQCARRGLRKSSPLRRVRSVFHRGEARSTRTRHVDDNADRLMTIDMTLRDDLTRHPENPFSHVAATAAECWLMLMVVPVLLLYIAYIPHDEHGHARSTLRERNADDDSGSRGLFDACPFGRYFYRRRASSVRKKARKNYCRPKTIVNDKEEDKNIRPYLRDYFTSTRITAHYNKISITKMSTGY